MRRPDVSILLIATLAAGLPGAAQEVVCRPNSLGTVSCPDSPRPMPRPIYRQPVQAIDRVRARPGAGDTAPVFVPAPQVRGLGKPILERSGRVGVCRPDTLGNLNCR